MSNGSNQSVVGNSRSDKRVDVVSTLGWFGEASLGFHVANFRHSFRKILLKMSMCACMCTCVAYCFAPLFISFPPFN